MIRVVLVDDQALFRAGIRMVIDSQHDLDVVGEAADGRAALDVVAQTRPDVVLMDIRMPVMDGLTATAELLGRPDPPRIVMLTTFDLDEAAARAIRQGASSSSSRTTTACSDGATAGILHDLWRSSGDCGGNRRRSRPTRATNRAQRMPRPRGSSSRCTPQRPADDARDPPPRVE